MPTVEQAIGANIWPVVFLCVIMMKRQLYAWALGKLSRKVQVMSKRWTVINSDVSVSWCDTFGGFYFTINSFVHSAK